MALNYNKLQKQSKNFTQLTGLTIIAFKKIVEQVRDDWEKIESSKKSHGRKSHIVTLEDKVLCVLIYYRAYISHTFLGYLFNLHNSNICRMFKKLEPLLAKKITIKKDGSLTPEKILKILVDVSEEVTQCPKK